MTPTRFSLTLIALWFTALIVLGLVLRMNYQYVTGGATGIVMVTAGSLYRREWLRNQPRPQARLRTVVTFDPPETVQRSRAWSRIVGKKES